MTTSEDKEFKSRSGGIFYVRRAWQPTGWCKSTVGVCNRQPLAKSKGVHGEVEPDCRQASSEGSWRQNSALRNTNLIRQTQMG